jgi:hypothetical protein
MGKEKQYKMKMHEEYVKVKRRMNVDVQKRREEEKQ